MTHEPTRNSSLCVANRRERKKLLVEHLGGKCEWCGFKGPVACFDFHHIDATKKGENISVILSLSSDEFIERIGPELKKCTLLCANCHRILHSSEISQ